MAKKRKNKIFTILILLLIIAAAIYVFMKLKKKEVPVLEQQTPDMSFSNCRKPENINKKECKKYFTEDGAVHENPNLQVQQLAFGG